MIYNNGLKIKHFIIYVGIKKGLKPRKNDKKALMASIINI